MRFPSYNFRPHFSFGERRPISKRGDIGSSFDPSDLEGITGGRMETTEELRGRIERERRNRTPEDIARDGSYKEVQGFLDKEDNMKVGLVDERKRASEQLKRLQAMSEVIVNSKRLSSDERHQAAVHVNQYINDEMERLKKVSDEHAEVRVAALQETRQEMDQVRKSGGEREKTQAEQLKEGVATGWGKWKDQVNKFWGEVKKGGFHPSRWTPEVRGNVRAAAVGFLALMFGSKILDKASGTVQSFADKATGAKSSLTSGMTALATLFGFKIASEKKGDKKEVAKTETSPDGKWSLSVMQEKSEAELDTAISQQNTKVDKLKRERDALQRERDQIVASARSTYSRTKPSTTSIDSTIRDKSEEYDVEDRYLRDLRYALDQKRRGGTAPYQPFVPESARLQEDRFADVTRDVWMYLREVGSKDSDQAELVKGRISQVYAQRANLVVELKPGAKIEVVQEQRLREQFPGAEIQVSGNRVVIANAIDSDFSQEEIQERVSSFVASLPEEETTGGGDDTATA